MNDNIINGLELACSVLPHSVSRIISSLDDSVKNELCEIRLRIDRPLAVSCKNKIYMLTPSSEIAHTAHEAYVVSGEAVTETFKRICGFSVYSFKRELS